MPINPKGNGSIPPRNTPVTLTLSPQDYRSMDTEPTALQAAKQRMEDAVMGFPPHLQAMTREAILSNARMNALHEFVQIPEELLAKHLNALLKQLDEQRANAPRIQVSTVKVQ